jgi:hypothetical protein
MKKDDSESEKKVEKEIAEKWKANKRELSDEIEKIIFSKELKEDVLEGIIEEEEDILEKIEDENNRLLEDSSKYIRENQEVKYQKAEIFSEQEKKYEEKSPVTIELKKEDKDEKEKQDKKFIPFKPSY